MANSRAGHEGRTARILDAAAAVIMRQGYDKTTMSDVAEEVGLTRGVVYLHFDSKDALFEVLIQREVLHYMQTWLEHIEADSRGGTIGGIYRSVLFAINSRPLMAAIMKRDRRLVGNYLRKPGNLFESMQAGSVNIDFLKALQAAGSVRQDVDPGLMSHILDIISYGLITVGDFRQPEQLPPYDTVMDTLADMLDRLLTPADGGNSEAGKAVIRELAAAARQQFVPMRQPSESGES